MLKSCILAGSTRITADGEKSAILTKALNGGCLCESQELTKGLELSTLRNSELFQQNQMLGFPRSTIRELILRVSSDPLPAQAALFIRKWRGACAKRLSKARVKLEVCS